MKKAVIGFFIIILFVQVGYAQDIIFFRNKTTVNAKITGLSERNISYKQYENQQGVLYATPISKIDSVKWESGEVSIYPLLHPAIKKKGYEIALELGMREQFNMNYLSSDAKYYRPVISSFIGVSQMYRINPHVAVGGVIGLDYSYWYEPTADAYLRDTSPSLYNAAMSYKVYVMYIPLSGRIKIDFIKRKTSPYFLLDCGYSFLIISSNKNANRSHLYEGSGLDVNAAIGFDVRFNNNAAVYFHAGYFLRHTGYFLRHKRTIAPFDLVLYARDIHSFSFNIGYKF